jgi:hypothetical protein
MTSAPATTRYILCILVSITAACSRSPAAASVPAVDLLRTFDRAEKRPAPGFDLAAFDLDGAARPSIVAPVPSRAIWSLPVPHRSVFRVFVALAPGAAAGPVRVRVGISDDRIYEGLAEARLTAGAPRWVELRADLRAYAGWQWSLFYRPDRLMWRLVLASDPLSTEPAQVLWGSPQILTDVDSAREYATRHAERRS